jgi:hypothetical protein
MCHETWLQSFFFSIVAVENVYAGTGWTRVTGDRDTEQHCIIASWVIRSWVMHGHEGDKAYKASIRGRGGTTNSDFCDKAVPVVFIPVSVHLRPPTSLVLALSCVAEQ